MPRWSIRYRMTPGIEGAAARAHRQPVDRREAHRAGDAAAGGQRAHARAVAEVQDDAAAARRLRVELRQDRCDVLVRQAVEAVALHAGVVQLAGQGEHLRELRLGAMERRVEASHLRQLGPALEQEPDRRQVVGLVQRRERNELRQVFQHRAVDAHRLGVLEPAVNDAVADARELRHRRASRERTRRCAGARRRGRAGCLRPRTSGRRRWRRPDPSRRSAARCGWPRPGRAPPARGRRPPNSENLMLDEPALRTAIASLITPPPFAAGPRAAPWRRGPPPRRRPAASRPSRPGWSG